MHCQVLLMLRKNIQLCHHYTEKTIDFETTSLSGIGIFFPLVKDHLFYDNTISLQSKSVTHKLSPLTNTLITNINN